MKRLYAAKLAQPTPAGVDPVVLFTAGMVSAADLGDLGQRSGKKLGQKASDSAMETFTKRLKKAQNEKGPIRFKKGKADVDPACDPIQTHRGLGYSLREDLE